MIEDVRVTTLPSGLVVATDVVPTVESVTLGAWVATGTRHEAPAVNGVSHLLEHMAFKGTRRRDARQIAEEIEAVGGHLNAYTSRDNTAYYARVLREDTGLALDILGDILQNSVFDAEELGREREVVVQEIHQALDTPDDIIFDYFQEAAFPDQALGRPVLGTVPVVRSLTRDCVDGYLRSTYAPERMVVAASGRLEHDAFVEAVARHFDALPTGGPLVEEPGRYRGGCYREERDLEQVHVVLGFEGVSNLDDAYYPLSVLATLHGGGMSSRLFQEIREKRGLAYSVYSFSSCYQDTGLYGVYAGTGEAEVAELIPVLCEETLRVVEGITAEEVNRARAQLKASLLMSMESTSSRCEHLARQLQVHGRPVPMAETLEKLDAVQVADVEACARRLFASAPTLAVIGPLSRVEDNDRMLARLTL
ncbi:M16 family metallopeptidase [Pararhodospirillum photometricum]|uniref:Processing peptidase n=1 Tax=Pararhodospirillum photometricum DSM 122 TaxID=1150469 RepID=H6SQQ0_PARPM|nr:pitrilysin family protein [Pararhodospirillum photometricum]CCG07365.1 Processing peptidase [Pararhodospirillum photometricum DSM 122]